MIDALLPHSPADYVRRPTVQAESPTLGLRHLQFEALSTTTRLSTNPNDFAVIVLLGLLGLRILEACGASINDLGEEHGHRVLRVRGKGGKVVLVPLPPAVGRAIDRAVGDREAGPIVRNAIGVRIDRHAATRRLKYLAATAGIRMPRMHPLSRPGARFWCCHQPVSPDRSPNPPCRSLGSGLSTVSAVRRGSWLATGLGSCCGRWIRR